MSRMLVVGNGFDLAHGLPTRYKDMIDELKRLVNFSDKASEWLDAEDVKRFYRNPFIRHFIRPSFKDNWTDFETEIQNIVSYLSCDHTKNPPYSHVDMYFSDLRHKWAGDPHSQLWPELQKHLDELIEYIDLYLSKYLPNVYQPQNYSQEPQFPDFIYRRKYDYFLSFNYTNTYCDTAETLDNGIGVDIPLREHFIHGRCSASGNPQNIVLGMDDNEPENLDTIYFKKYFQRIQKRTGREVYDWFAADKEIEVDIFGHSMDTTDRDVLLMILNTAVLTHIYYYNQADYEQKIINLIRLYGNPDEFTKRYYAHKIDLHPIDPYMQKNRSTDP